jgi:hypothetical protein
LEGPYAYILPSAVGALINKVEKSKPSGILAQADVLEVLYGVQNYTNTTIELKENEDITKGGQDQNLGQLFSPRGANHSGSRRYTGRRMLGTFPVVPPQFTDSSVWSILNQFLNPAVNEMYTCLRVNPDGFVVPTLVLRQLPFSTGMAKISAPVTLYMDVPRWIADPILVKQADVGFSDSSRINFVHVYGDPGPANSPGAQSMASIQYVRNVPIHDDLDIARSGLRPYMTTVTCAAEDVQNGSAGVWMKILADIVMGGHLTLSGIVELHGVQAPICPGDNFEWEGVVYHIESVSHRCSLAGFNKTFTTTLSLSHGLRNIYPAPSTDLELYPGTVVRDDLRDNEPGITTDNSDQDPVETRAGDTSLPDKITTKLPGTDF